MEVSLILLSIVDSRAFYSSSPLSLTRARTILVPACPWVDRPGVVQARLGSAEPYLTKASMIRSGRSKVASDRSVQLFPGARCRRWGGCHGGVELHVTIALQAVQAHARRSRATRASVTYTSPYLTAELQKRANASLTRRETGCKSSDLSPPACHGPPATSVPPL